MGAWEAANHVSLVIAFIIGGAIVPAIGPKGAYALGGVTGIIGTAMLLPLLRLLPGRPSSSVDALRSIAQSVRRDRPPARSFWTSHRPWGPVLGSARCPTSRAFLPD